MYYDRGELFSYFSPGYAIGTVTGGPFGVNQQLPFVTAQSCPRQRSTLYEGYIPTCGGAGQSVGPHGTDRCEGQSGKPLRLRPEHPRRPIRKASDLSNYLPNLAEIENFRPARLTRRLRPHQQAALHLQLHARHPVAAAQRPRHRTRLCRQPRPPPGDSGSVQSAGHRDPRPVRSTARSTPTATPSTDESGNVVPSIFRTAAPTARTTKAATSTIAFPTSATRPNPSTTRPPASTPTTRSRRMSKSA